MNEDDALQHITDRLIAYIEELFEFKDELETQFQYGERVAYTECLEWIQKFGFRYNVSDANGKISSRLCGGFFRAVRRTEERPLAVFVCAKMPEGVCFFPFFSAWRGGGKKKRQRRNSFRIAERTRIRQARIHGFVLLTCRSGSVK